MIDYDKPDDDPIVAEVRRAREEIAARCGYDLAKICAEARRREKELRRAGWTIISLPPRRPANWREPLNQVG